jgi:type VI secretion system protein ImpK
MSLAMTNHKELITKQLYGDPLDQLVPDNDDDAIEIHSYYRAKTFVTQPGINPLCSAAAPLLAFIPRIRQTLDYANVEELQQNLIHELNAFASHARRYHYPEKQVQIARYLLTSTLDEIISNTLWGKNWLPYRLTNHSFGEHTEHEPMLAGLTRLLYSAKDYRDILELFYICLNLGYCSQALTQHGEQNKIEQLSNQLYQVIRQHRQSTATTPKQRIKRKPINLSYPILALLLSIFLLLGVYQGFNYLLRLSSHSLLQQLALLQTLQSDEGY